MKYVPGVLSVTLILFPGWMTPLRNFASRLELPEGDESSTGLTGKLLVLNTLSVCGVPDERFVTVTFVPGGNASACE